MARSRPRRKQRPKLRGAEHHRRKRARLRLQTVANQLREGGLDFTTGRKP